MAPNSPSKALLGCLGSPSPALIAYSSLHGVLGTLLLAVTARVGACLVTYAPGSARRVASDVVQHVGVAKDWASVLGSLYEGSYHFGSIFGVSDFWKLPYRGLDPHHKQQDIGFDVGISIMAPDCVGLLRTLVQGVLGIQTYCSGLNEYQ